MDSTSRVITRRSKKSKQIKADDLVMMKNSDPTQSSVTGTI